MHVIATDLTKQREFVQGRKLDLEEAIIRCKSGVLRDSARVRDRLVQG
jgi:hypothetical protein